LDIVLAEVFLGEVRLTYESYPSFWSPFKSIFR
jgi:hypothetical protein